MVINKTVVARLELMACYQTDQRYLKKNLIVSLLNNKKFANHKTMAWCIS